MKKNTGNNTIVILGLAIVGLLVLYYFLYNSITTIGQRVRDLSWEAEQKVKQEQEIKNLANSINGLTLQTGKIDLYFVPIDGEVNFIDRLENIAKSQKLDVETSSVIIDSPKSLRAEKFEYLVLRLKTEGSWYNTYKFLSIIPNLPYKITIDKVDMTLKSDSESIPHLWQGSFTVRVLKKSSR